MKSRRKFIKSSLLGLTAITFPNIITANINQDYDVVVIGAGAAGLAATNEFRKQGGKSVLCLEASNRIGGRVWTDNSIFKKPYDVGALWIENGNTSPYIKFAEKNSKFKKREVLLQKFILFMMETKLQKMRMNFGKFLIQLKHL